MEKDQLSASQEGGIPLRGLLVIGGSAGSLSVVLKIVPLLKKALGLAVVIVFHRKQSEDSALIDVLASRTEMLVKEIDDKDELAAGVIYLAPADYHVLIEKDHSVTLDDSEKVNFSRPSIDVTFESAAEVFGDKLICLLLSGANADGVEGLRIARSLGGYAMVQDPATAEVPYMPRQAVERAVVDKIIDPARLEELLAVLVR
jgi:two-component system, chemotaxis family, protein-glutamate methylesterase/glutaminase